MVETVHKPSYIKHRREDGFGLVYNHRNYGYEDASLTEVNETVIDVLEHVENGDSREHLEATFSPAVVEALLERGVLTDGE